MTPRAHLIAPALACLLSCATTAPHSASPLTGGGSASLQTQPNRWQCASTEFYNPSTPVVLCVKPVMFGDDLYTLEVGAALSTACGRADVLCLSSAGKDVDIDRGLEGEYRSHRVALHCAPVLGRDKDGGTVELARHCAVAVDDSERWRVEVLF